MSKNTKNTKNLSKRSTKTKKSHPKHFLKVYWPYIPIILVVIFGMIYGSVLPVNQVSQPATLAYSTEMSITGLLNGTNSQRINAGLGSLTINSLLNSSAQAKANDMVSKDYWSHNTPSGQEPWVFFDGAGYLYQKAGENLAYGFSTSSETIVGWMNSPSHKANILDSAYTEVGFGFANSQNFVGTGEETVVVAHYASPTNPPPPPPTTTPETPSSQTPAVQSEQQTSVPVENQIVEESKPNTAKTKEKPKSKPIADDRYNQPINTDYSVPEESKSKNITLLQKITGGRAPWSALALSVISMVIVCVWLVKHALLVKRFIHRGEHFVAHHPIVDLTVVIVVALAVYLSQSSGVVL